jgi:hypothetical protein
MEDSDSSVASSMISIDVEFPPLGDYNIPSRLKFEAEHDCGAEVDNWPEFEDDEYAWLDRSNHSPRRLNGAMSDEDDLKSDSESDFEYDGDEESEIPKVKYHCLTCRCLTREDILRHYIRDIYVDDVIVFTGICDHCIADHEFARDTPSKSSNTFLLPGKSADFYHELVAGAYDHERMRNNRVFITVHNHISAITGALGEDIDKKVLEFLE